MWQYLCNSTNFYAKVYEDSGDLPKEKRWGGEK